MSDLFTGTYIPINVYPEPRYNNIVDNLLTPRLVPYRQVVIYDEVSTLQNDGITWKQTYGNWLEDYQIQVRVNGELVSNSALYVRNNMFGTLTFVTALGVSDRVSVTYCFDYFGSGVLKGLVNQAFQMVNTMSIGSATDYKVTDCPDYWDGAIAEWAFIFALDKLILDYDMWYGRLIFAIPSMEDASDIVGVLQSLKNDSENRANKIMDNERFKIPPTLALPTSTYYAAVRGGAYANRTRGWRSNRIY